MKIAVKSDGQYSKAVREIEKIAKDLSNFSSKEFELRFQSAPTIKTLVLNSPNRSVVSPSANKTSIRVKPVFLLNFEYNF